MRILALSDQESASLWDYFTPEKLEGIDLILSCGDLEPSYLSFLATFAPCPVLYVHGNHDEKYVRNPPEGCICIEDDIYVYKGVRILGLGGSIRYRPGAFQYTQGQMARRVRRLWFKLWRKKGFDILLTHSPALDLNDGEDLPHRGFQVFRRLLDRYRPPVFVHGHIHLTYSHRGLRCTQYGPTQVINAYEKYIFELPDPEPAGAVTP